MSETGSSSEKKSSSNQKKMSKESIQELMKNVQNVEKEIENGFRQIIQEGHDPSNTPVVLFLGPTGSGKTTLYYGITDKELQGYKDGKIRRLKASHPEDNFKIGDTGFSQTSVPGMKHDKNKDLIICDCPGFFDNRGDIQDIVNSFAIYRVLSQSKNAKILLLSSEHDVESSKGKAIRDSCLLVEKLMPDKEILRTAVALVVTKANPDTLDDGGFLEEVEPGDSYLLKQFKNRESGRKRIVFAFPSPKSITDPYSDFNDKDNILNFIRNGDPTPIKPFISLSSDAKLMILSGIDSFGCLSNLLQKFVDKITVDSSISEKDLGLWLDRCNKFSTEKYSSPKEFVEKAKKIIVPSSNKYEALYQEFLRLHEWRSFLERITKEDMSENEQIMARKSEIMSSVFLDISTYLAEILTPCRSLILTRLEAVEMRNKKDKTIEDMENEKKLMEKMVEEEKKAKFDAEKREKETREMLDDYKRKLESIPMNQGGNGGGGGGGAWWQALIPIGAIAATKCNIF